MTLQPQILLGRLALIRYMYELAIHQSRQSGRRQATSILTFHDAVEMAMILGLQHHDLPLRGDLRFAQYWTELESVDVHVTHRSTMETLNRVRVNLKHHGVMPAQIEIEAARVHVRDFFVENIPIMFGLNLEDVSLVPTVSYDEARGRLEEAEARMRQQAYNDAITEIGFAFHALIEEYERRMSSAYGRSPYVFSVVPGYVSFSNISNVLGGSGSSSFLGSPASPQDALERFARDVEGALGAIQKGLKILSLGLDYNRYVRFLHLTPAVSRHNGQWRHGMLNRPEATLEECQDCLDFVIDAALRLQDAERE